MVDTSVAQHGDGLSSIEVYDCLEELESLGLIKMLQPIGDTKENGRPNFQATEHNKRRIRRTTPKPAED